MAKKSKIAKLEHQRATVAKYAAKRAALKEAGDYIGLSKLPGMQVPFAYTTATSTMVVPTLTCVSLGCLV